MKKILVVDDNKHILKAIKLILKKYGFKVDVTNKGKEALLKAESGKPDLILFDVNVTDSDGRLICSSIKESDKTREIPVIITSTHSNCNEMMLSTHAEDFIRKPYEINELVNKINTLIPKMSFA